MKVYVTSAYPTRPEHTENFASLWLIESAKEDPIGIHTLVYDPEEADIILFMESHPENDLFFEKVLKHPLRKKYKSKTFLYHDSDYAFPLMPFISPSIKKAYHDNAWSRSGVYMARIAENHAIKYNPSRNTADFLFSFIGANNCRVRADILHLHDPKIYTEDTSNRHAWQLPPHERIAYEQGYASVLQRSEFILCPRGIGPSTYRLYEAMEMGKCPVILSDDWVEPPFIPWSEFSVRVLEADHIKLPEILASYSAIEMGVRARKVWEEYVSKPVCFHWLVESCVDILRERIKKAPRTATQYFKFTQSEYFPEFYVRSKLRNMKHRIACLSK